MDHGPQRIRPHATSLTYETKAAADLPAAAFVLRMPLSKSGEFFLRDLNIRGLQEIDGVLVSAIGNTKDDAGNASVDQCLCAMDAGQVRDITGRAFGRDSMQSGLDDGIRLGMDGTNAMSIHHQVSNFIAVILSGRGAVKAGGQDALIHDQNTADKGAVTRTSL